MALCREMTAPHATVEARQLLKGTIIRFVQDTYVTHRYESGDSTEVDSVVFVGRVGKSVDDTFGLNPVTDVEVDLLGRFQFNPRTLVEVITDTEGLQIPYGEEMTLEQTATRASRAIPTEEYVND